jgi:hypothetical protein
LIYLQWGQLLSYVERVLEPTRYAEKLETKSQYLTRTNRGKLQYQQLYHVKNMLAPGRFTSFNKSWHERRLSLPSFPHHQDRWSQDELTPSSSSSLIADLLSAIVSEGTTSLPHAIWSDGQANSSKQNADLYSTSLTHFMLKSVDTVGSMVVSATFVCRFHPYADEMLTSLGYHLTSSGGGISTFRILQPCWFQRDTPFNKPWHIRRSLAGRRRVLSAYQYIRLCTTGRPTRISFASSLSINHLLWPATYLPNLPAGDMSTVPLTEACTTICLRFARSSCSLSLRQISAYM